MTAQQLNAKDELEKLQVKNNPYDLLLVQTIRFLFAVITTTTSSEFTGVDIKVTDGYMESLAEDTKNVLSTINSMSESTQKFCQANAFATIQDRAIAFYARYAMLMLEAIPLQVAGENNDPAYPVDWDMVVNDASTVETHKSVGDFYSKLYNAKEQMNLAAVSIEEFPDNMLYLKNLYRIDDALERLDDMRAGRGED